MKNNLARLIYPEFRFGKTEMSDARRLVETGVGGFCVYGGTVEEVFRLTRLLQSFSPAPLLFCADYENGAGQWLGGATELPSNMAVGASGSEEIARRKAEITASEASAMGINWILSPVLDLATRPDNPIVNTRAFGDSPELVKRLGGAYLSGLKAGGVLSCLKHFPGHGETSQDSHLSLPALDRTLSQLDSFELSPYKALLPSADAVMTGHLKFSALDPEMPASFSKRITTGLLRNKLGFNGCVATDALSMNAVADERFAGVMALLAGADILLVPDNPLRLYESLLKSYGEGTLNDSIVRTALERQSSMARRLGAQLLNRPSLDRVGCREHRAFVEESSGECLAWTVKPPKPVLSKGDKVGYMEPGVSEPGKWAGKAFVSELKALGAEVSPFSPGKNQKLLVSVFSAPRAYRGNINLKTQEREEISSVLKRAGRLSMVSFGSPFVFDGFDGKIEAGLCAFCGLEAFQKACAGAFFENRKVSGIMPVTAHAETGVIKE